MLSYGPSYPDLVRRAAVYADRILKGTKPMKALGVTVPVGVLQRADRIIQ